MEFFELTTFFVEYFIQFYYKLEVANDFLCYIGLLSLSLFLFNQFLNWSFILLYIHFFNIRIIWWNLIFYLLLGLIKYIIHPIIALYFSIFNFYLIAFKAFCQLLSKLIEFHWLLSVFFSVDYILKHHFFNRIYIFFRNQNLLFYISR